MVATLVLTALFSQQSKLGDPVRIPVMQLQTVKSKAIQIPVKDAKVTVLLFLLSDCPIANRYAPEIVRLERDYKEKGVKFVRVYVYAFESLEKIDQHTKEYHYTSDAIHDKDRILVSATKARVTPEVAVILESGEIVYQGRIDDRYLEHSRLRETDYRKDLRIALDEITSGRPVTLSRTTALGCFIE